MVGFKRNFGITPHSKQVRERQEALFDIEFNKIIKKKKLEEEIFKDSFLGGFESGLISLGFRFSNNVIHDVYTQRLRFHSPVQKELPINRGGYVFGYLVGISLGVIFEPFSQWVPRYKNP